MSAFEASAPFSGLIGPRVRLGNVSLVGIDIRIPPGGLKPAVSVAGHEQPRSEAAATTVVHRHRRDRVARCPARDRDAEAEQAAARLRDSRRRHARLRSARGCALPGRRDQCHSARPRRDDRRFGPWLTEDPSLTPIRGEYTFKKADLNDIKGISGILSSVGQYRGTLERIEVDGQTETPDFSIDIANQPVPLFTRFKAIVDGTNGDTWLDRVDAKLGKSNIIASGAIVRDRDVKGRHVALDIQITRARIEDMLRLAVKADKAPLTGRMEMTTTFLLPAGEQDVIDRLNLNGRFRLAQARFTNIDIQRRIEALSLRARGNERREATGIGSSVVSNMRGRFVMRGARSISRS